MRNCPSQGQRARFSSFFFFFSFFFFSERGKRVLVLLTRVRRSLIVWKWGRREISSGSKVKMNCSSSLGSNNGRVRLLYSWRDF